MKKAFVMIAALLVFVGFSTLTFAQAQHPAEAPAAAVAVEQKTEVMKGTLVSLNLETKTMVVKVKEGEKEVEKTIAAGQVDQAALSALKAGDLVNVTYSMAGEGMKAEKVEVVLLEEGKDKKDGKAK